MELLLMEKRKMALMSNSIVHTVLILEKKNQFTGAVTSVISIVA
jgi:hypothetical protein